MDEERYVQQRARFIARTTDLREPEAKAVAYMEKGYSQRGAAKQLDSTESTVQAHLERAMARYGLSITETLLPNEEPPEISEVQPGYHRELPHEDEQLIWLTYVDRHQKKLPPDWVAEVLNAAKKDGIKPNISKT